MLNYVSIYLINDDYFLPIFISLILIFYVIYKFSYSPYFKSGKCKYQIIERKGEKTGNTDYLIKMVWERKGRVYFQMSKENFKDKDEAQTFINNETETYTETIVS